MYCSQYLVLHSGDKIFMKKCYVEDIAGLLAYLNGSLEEQLKLGDYKRDVVEAASHIEIVPLHKQHSKKYAV